MNQFITVVGVKIGTLADWLTMARAFFLNTRHKR